MRLTADLTMVGLPDTDPHHDPGAHYQGMFDFPDTTTDLAFDLSAPSTTPLGRPHPLWFKLRLSHLKGLAQRDWVRCWAGVVDAGGSPLGRGPLPLAFYVGEPTDMPTGVARFPLGLSYNPRTLRWEPTSAVALLSVRRSA